MATRLVQQMREPFLLPHGASRVGVSAGVAAAPQGSGAVPLFAAADTAMYQAKQSGKGRVVLVAFQAVEPAS